MDNGVMTVEMAGDGGLGVSLADVEAGERRTRDRNPECSSPETGPPIRDGDAIDGRAGVMGDSLPGRHGCRWGKWRGRGRDRVGIVAVATLSQSGPSSSAADPDGRCEGLDINKVQGAEL